MDLIMIEINLRFLLGKKMIVNLGLSHDSCDMIHNIEN